MIKRRTLLTVIVIAAFLGNTLQAETSEATQLNGEVFRAAVLEDFPPLYVTLEDGRPGGFAIDLMEQVAAIAGFQVEYLPAENWEEAKELVRSGAADFIPAIGIDQRREEEFLFSRNVEVIPVSIFVRKENTSITDANSLKNYNVAVINESAAETEFYLFYPEIQTIGYDNIDTALVDLLSGAVDAFVFPKPVLMNKAKDINVENQLRIAGDPLMELHRGFLLRESDADLLMRINEAIEEYIQTNDYLESKQFWYGEPETGWSAGQVLRIAVLVLTGVTLLFAAFYLNHRRMFKNKLLEKQQELLVKQEIISALYQSMRELVTIHQVVKDENGKVSTDELIDCNQAFLEAINKPKDEITGLSVREIYGDTLYKEEASLARVLESGEPHEFYAYGSFSDRYYHLSVVPVRHNQMALISTDVTDNYRAQLEIKAKNKELEQILHVVSHDFRSPLSNIDGFSQEIQFDLEDLEKIITKTRGIKEPKDPTETDPPDLESEALLQELKQCTYYIRASIKQMDKLLKGLIKLSRYGRDSLVITTLDMKELINSILQSVEYRIESENIQVQVLDLPPCKGDEMQVTQIFANLIDNAIKYRSPDRQSWIRITGVQEGKYSVYCVEDNGIGVSQENQKIIFDIFQRVDKERDDGDGLGLSIVQQMLGRLDGSISLESQLDEGSRFYIKLPHG